MLKSLLPLSPLRLRCLFVASFLFSLQVITAQNDCVDAIIVCGNSGFVGLTASGAGTQELNGAVTCGSSENNSIWLRLNINTSGTLAFTLTPESTDISEDFDFFIFGPNATCNNLGTSIRCSTTNPLSIGQGDNLTGMNDTENDVSEGPGASGNSFLKSLDVLGGESYFLVIDRPVGNSNFSIQWSGTATFNEPPSFQIPVATVIDLKQCDTDGVNDFSTDFDLTQNTPVIIGTQTDVAVTYHTSSNDAITGDNQIPNPAAFPNTQNPQTVYARITNQTTGCFNFVDFKLEINNSIAIPKDSFSICDDAADGNDANGKATFNLDEVTPFLFNNEDISDFTVNYYRNATDASSGSNVLPQFFYNTVPNEESVFIKVFNSAGCNATKEVHLKVDALPLKKTITLVQCDEDLVPDGLSLFNLEQASGDFTGNDPNLSVAYYVNAIDAAASQNELLTYTNTSNPEQIVAKITDHLTGCYSLSTLNLAVNVSPPQTRTIAACNALDHEDGLTVFDLNDSGFLLSGTETIAFYPTAQDALLEQNTIAAPQAFHNTTPYSQTVFARIEDGNNCNSINTVNLVVNQLPNITVNGSGKDFACLNLPDRYITLDAAVLDNFPSGYEYLWEYNGIPFPSVAYSIQVNLPGTYTVTVINPLGCRKTRTIEVFPSNNAAIDDVLVQDVTTDNNTVTVILTASSIGEYEYSLDLPQGPFQLSNTFENVASGIHDLYINDINGCGIVAHTIAVLGVPRFFTPNGDGANDFWKVDGVDNAFNAQTKMYIFDRFGALIKEVPAKNSEGWDGTLKGKPLPADDYWYLIHFEDGRTTRGHFALKR